MTATALPFGGHVNPLASVPDVGGVHWSFSNDVLHAVVEANRCCGMVLVTGRAGFGKSWAVARAAERCLADPVQPAEVVWVDFTLGQRGKGLIEEAYLNIVGTLPGRRSRAVELIHEIRLELHAPHRVLVVDEAQEVSPKALLALCKLLDDPRCDFSLVVVSTPEHVGKIPAPVFSRATCWLQGTGLSDQEVVGTLRAFHWLFESADPVLLVDANRRIAHGEFRWWANFLGHWWNGLRPSVGDQLTEDVFAVVAAKMRHGVDR